MPRKNFSGEEARKKGRKRGLTSFSSHGTISVEEGNSIGMAFLVLWIS
jgi:hypothetical protein